MPDAKPETKLETQKKEEVVIAVNYKDWKGKNQFCCRGKCVTGPKSQIIPSLIVHFLLTAISGIWFGALLPYLLTESSSDNIVYRQPNAFTKVVDIGIGVISLLVQLLALKSQLMDPGLIPRQQHQPPSENGYFEQLPMNAPIY